MAAAGAFIVCIPMLCRADFHYYGSTWKGEMIYYVTNIDIESKDTATLILLIISLTTNIIILIWSIVYYC